MCEIFFLYARNGTVNAESLENLLKAALPAAKRNDDGFGIFNDKKEMFKTKKKLKNGHIPNLVDEFEDSKFVVFHLRLATRGNVNKKNAHPFKHDNNLLVHNGTVEPRVSREEDRADSYNMLREINHQNDGDTVKAIQDTMEDTSGRVSVFLHDDNHDLYYFRETSKFTLAMNPVTQEYVGATRGRRLHNVWDEDRGQVSFFDNLQAKDPEEGKIYRIDEEDIHEEGEFEMDNNSWSSGSYSGHPQTSSSQRYGTGNQTQFQNTSDSDDQDIDACCVLQEEELDEDEWSKEAYEKEKTGFTEDEWQDFIAQKQREEEQRGRMQGMSDIYDLEEAMYGFRTHEKEVPQSLPEEVYDEHAPEEDIELEHYDEQEYWEQKEQEWLEENDVDFPELEEDHREKDLADLYQNVEDEEGDSDDPQVQDLVDEDVEAGLRKLFGEQPN